MTVNSFFTLKLFPGCMCRTKEVQRL